MNIKNQRGKFLIKPKAYIKNNEESGKFFFILGQSQQALKKANRIDEINLMGIRVFASTSYAEAIKIVREYVDLIDVNGII